MNTTIPFPSSSLSAIGALSPLDALSPLVALAHLFLISLPMSLTPSSRTHS
ncbi:hypothetical protein Scep_010153 [Stephania cephalantha]|uniref:Uncharacterized protein n=1 Tax=Stephania cephalantha TaxID=152367 RepID=A0AAP0JUJ8_9MAGN